MFEQLKILLTEEYNSELSRFENLKNQIEELEVEMQSDHSEEEYQKNLKELNKKYGLFRNNKKEYKKDLTDLQMTYQEKLVEFQKKYDHYIDLKAEASHINIYGIQKKLDQLNMAKSLEDLRMTEEEAAEIIQGKTSVMM